jgi:PKD repeat protein
MRIGLALLLAAVLLAGVAVSAGATDYYVATTGNNTNPGTSAEPWRTLQYAVDTIGPGDTILVQSGSYLGFHLNNSGSSGSPCTIKADTGATVLVNAAGPSNWHNSNIEGEDVSYWVIEGFESSGSARYGIDIRVTDHVTVRNCHVHDSVVTGIFLAFADYSLVEGNDTHNNGEHGIYNSNSADYVTLRGNQSHSNYGCGLHNNGDISMGGDGLISFATIENNVIWDNGVGGGSAINCDGVSDSIIRNNLMYNNHASGISLYGGDSAECSSRDQVYNNTIIMPSNGRWAINIPSAGGGQPSHPTGNSLVNNLLYSFHSWRGVITVWGPGALAVSDYNVVMDRFSPDEDATVLTLAEWQALGFDAHSFLATPDALFTNPAADDYHLKTGSPAIDTGTNLAEVTSDLEGLSRPQGSSTDIGCYEVFAGPLPPTADFSTDVTAGPRPLAVTFTDQSSNSPASWTWDFGDSGTAATQNPTHDYAALGSYTVSLTAANSYGSDTETKTGYISVSTFQDVLPNHWAWSQVEACVAAGIVGGYGSNYRPGLTVTRDAMAVFISRGLAGDDAHVPTGPPTATFDDVPTDHWAFRYVEYAVDEGVVGGFGSLYRPTLTVTREAMAVFVARAMCGGDASVPTGPPTAFFTDVPTDHWAFRYVEYCHDQGVVGGYGDGTYRPLLAVTRDAMAVYIQRAFSLPM